MGASCQQPCVGSASSPRKGDTGQGTTNISMSVTDPLIMDASQSSQMRDGINKSGRTTQEQRKDKKSKRSSKRRNIVRQVIKIQRAWRANIENIRRASKLRQQRLIFEQNRIFKGEFALSNDDYYERHYASTTDKRLDEQRRELGEADAGSLDDDSNE